MSIGIDVSVLGIALEGIGRYTSRLLQELGRLEDAPRLKAFSYGRNRPSLDALGFHPEAHAHWGVPGKAAVLLWRCLRWPGPERFIGPMELFHATNHVVPPLKGVPYVFTLYDLFFLKKEKRDCTWEERRYREGLSLAVASASRIICLSEYVADEAKERWSLPEDRVDVIPGGVDEFSRPEDPNEIEETLLRLGARSPYLLHVGYQGVRKNLSRLVDAFAPLAKKGCHLVLAGREGPATPGLRARCGELDISDRVRFLGYVDREALACLYAGAACFVFPSIEEGFGLPVLEAMSAGVPVVASRRGSLPEVAGDAGLLVDCEDADELGWAMDRAVHEDVLRAELIRKGRERAAGYRWSETARKTAACYKECLS